MTTAINKDKSLSNSIAHIGTVYTSRDYDGFSIGKSGKKVIVRLMKHDNLGRRVHSFYPITKKQAEKIGRLLLEAVVSNKRGVRIKFVPLTKTEIKYEALARKIIERPLALEDDLNNQSLSDEVLKCQPK